MPYYFFCFNHLVKGQIMSIFLETNSAYGCANESFCNLECSQANHRNALIYAPRTLLNPDDEALRYM